MLTELPENLYDFYTSLDHRRDFFRFQPSSEDCDRLLNLKPSHIVLEPTGGWYSSYWALFCERHDIEVCFVSHAQLKSQRLHFGFSNKTDYEDSLVLSACWFDPAFRRSVDGSKRFLKDYRPLITRDLWDSYCEIEQLDKLRNSNVNRLRQRCSLEFPEIAKVPWDRCSSGFTPWIQFLAGSGGGRLAKSQQKKYDSSCAHRIGVEISPHTRRLSKIVLDVEEQLTQTETDLIYLLDLPELQPYKSVLDKWAFSSTMQALLIGKIYPFDKFLRDGQPWFISKISKQGRDYQRDKSKSLFCAYLGFSKRIEQSGDGLKTAWAGSALVRSHLYPWFLCTVCPPSCRKTDYRQEVGLKYDGLIANGVKGKDAIIRCCYFVIQRIYRDLLKVLA